MFEWTKLPRGTYQLSLNGKTADVFKIGGQGWRWNILDDASGCYLAYGKGCESLDDACEAALFRLEQ